MTVLPYDRPLGFYEERFRSLPALEAAEFQGVFDGLVVGPDWFRTAFRAMMVGGGLAGWQGKEFLPSGEGANLCLRGGALRRVAPMYVAGVVASVLDGRPTLALRYRGASPRRFIQDELRRDAGAVLGMTYYDLGPFRRIVMPFALVPRA